MNRGRKLGYNRVMDKSNHIIVPGLAVTFGPHCVSARLEQLLGPQLDEETGIVTDFAFVKLTKAFVNPMTHQRFPMGTPIRVPVCDLRQLQ